MDLEVLFHILLLDFPLPLYLISLEVSVLDHSQHSKGADPEIIGHVLT